MNIKFIVEKHNDCYISYPIGVQGVVAGQGSTYLEALNDAKSALRFHIETFGEDVLNQDSTFIDAFLTEEVLA